MGQPINEAVVIPPRRSLTRNQRVRMFDAHKGVCILCGTKIQVGEAWIDEHIDPLEISGNNAWENRGPAHVKCAKVKTRRDLNVIAKVKRVRAKHLGIRRLSRFPCARTSPYRKKLTGEVVRR
ncbi:MAG TPA: HNH endonuclease signature motif containing protein [Pseudolabrys sp.]|nr:HNH endonuclease signature motif containing protein [Pseudolabrys sp.]